MKRVTAFSPVGENTSGSAADLFGERQSGVPTFRVADPLRDEALNEVARDAADAMLAEDPELLRAEHAALRRVMGERYARSLELFRVG